MKPSHSIFKTFFLSLCILANTHFAYGQTASILPPAKTTFFDSNGKPLTSGTVDFYIPGQTVRKTTWQDAAETTPNTNPVVLDAAGRALILGSGSYRQVVKDRLGNLIWDQVTSSTGSGGGGGPTATGDGDLVGTIKPWAGMSAPNQYMFTYGQQISRTTYSVLFTAITSAQPVFCTSGNPTLTGLSDTTNFWIGMTVEATCLAAGSSTVISKTSSTVTLAANPNVTTNITATFFPWGNGNGTTTFNIPDFRGFAIAGNNNMGGVANSVLTTTFFGATNPNSAGAAGGSQSSNIILLTNNLPPYTPIVTPLAGGNTPIVVPTGSSSQSVTTSGGTAIYQTGSYVALTNVGTPQGGISTPIVASLIQPTKTSNYIIKVTPDTNSATASGVTSIQGMTGDIACGIGLTCTGNIISVTSAGAILAPKFLRYLNINSVFSFTPDAAATLLDIVLVGAGGGGTGNGANNAIPYYQYGDIGTATAFGATQITVTISQATPGVITTPTHGSTWECNRPFYFSNNGDTLPIGLSFNTIYYTYCGTNPIGSNTQQPTATTFSASVRSFNTPITCALYAPNCQTAITTSSAGSGTHILNMYTYVATAGSGGGGVGDGGLPGTYMGCDSNGAAGYLQSVGVVGGVGGNFYGNNIAPGIGGAGRYGGGGQNASVGTDLTGGGGSGAFPTPTSSGGGGGGGGGSCHIIIKPTLGQSYPILCGVAGAAGPAASQSVTFTNASPTVMTATAAQFPPNGAVVLTGGSLPTGVTAGTTYYIAPTDETGNTFNLLTTPYGSAVNTTSTGSGTVTSGTPGSRGAYGSCEIWQYYGAN